MALFCGMDYQKPPPLLMRCLHGRPTHLRERLDIKYVGTWDNTLWQCSKVDDLDTPPDINWRPFIGTACVRAPAAPRYMLSSYLQDLRHLRGVERRLVSGSPNQVLYFRSFGPSTVCIIAVQMDSADFLSTVYQTVTDRSEYGVTLPSFSSPQGPLMVGSRIVCWNSRIFSTVTRSDGI